MHAPHKRPAPHHRVPEGWVFFQECAGAVIFTRRLDKEKVKAVALIPMKCPLDEQFSTRLAAMESQFVRPANVPVIRNRNDRALAEGERAIPANHFAPWTPTDAFETVRRSGFNPLLVLNLCATERYYLKEEVLDNDVNYEWINVPGGGVVPPEGCFRSLSKMWDELFDSFGRTCDLKQLNNYVCGRTAFPPLLPSRALFPAIIIHCTHGVNRTGLITAFLMLYHSASATPDGVIDHFGIARGHDINKVEFLRGLREEVAEYASAWKKGSGAKDQSYLVTSSILH